MKEDNKWINMVYILSIVIMYDFVEVWLIVSQRILHFWDVIPFFFFFYKNYLWKYDNNNKHISLILPSLPDWSILYWFAIKRTISGKSTIQITNIQRSGQRLPFYFFFIIYTNLKIWFLKYNTSLYIF